MNTQSQDLLNHAHTQMLLRQALEEDVGGGDASSLAVLAGSDMGEGSLVARQHLVVAGLPLAEAVFLMVDPEMHLERRVDDGAPVGPGEVLLTLSGGAQSILTAERTALNFLQRLSGIATLTASASRCRRLHGRGDSRHPQDHPGVPTPGEVRRPLRRRPESPHGPLRPDHAQGQPPRGVAATSPGRT